MIVIGDLHLTRDNYNDVLNALSQVLNKHQEDNKIIFLGDIFNSSSIRATTMLEISNKMKEILKDKNYIILTGNHDYYSDEIKLTQIFGDKAIDKIKIIDSNLFLPYFENIERDEIVYYLMKNNIKYIFMHYDIFKEHKHLNFLLEEKPLIISGHLHDFKRNKKYIYVGNFYFNNFADAGKETPYYLVINDNDIQVLSHTYSPVFVRLVLEEPMELEEIQKIYDKYSPREVFIRFVLKVASHKDKKQWDVYVRSLFANFKNIDIQYQLNINEDIINNQQVSLKLNVSAIAETLLNGIHNKELKEKVKILYKKHIEEVIKNDSFYR